MEWVDNLARKTHLDKDAQHVSDQLRIISQAIAQCVGEGEYPLPDGHLGENTIREMRCRVGHPAATTSMPA